MSNLRIIDSSLSDSATLADGNSNIAASMPVTNLQNSLSQYFTRTTNTNDLIINVDFTADQVISAVHLGRTNFTSSATWRIQCYPNANQTAGTNVTNLLTNTQSFSGWALTNVQLSSTSVAAPDGTYTAKKLSEDTGTGTHQVTQSHSVTAGDSYTFSFYFKSAERDAIRVSFGSAAFGASIYVGFTGAGTDTIYTAGTNTTSTIDDVGNGWLRCSVSSQATASILGYFAVRIYKGGTSYAGDGVSGIYIWGAQLEQSASATTYEPNPLLSYDSGDHDFVIKKGWGEFDWGVDAWGSSAMDDWEDKFATHWFSAVSARSMKITISDSGNGDGYLQAGRLFVGRYFSPQTNCDWGAALRWVDASEQYRTAGGSLRTENKYTYREIDIQLSWLDDGESTKLLDMQKGNGKRSDYFFSLYPDGTGQRKLHHEFIAKMQDTSPMGLRFVNYSTNSIRFVES